jgi:hypothetical protein
MESPAKDLLPPPGGETFSFLRVIRPTQKEVGKNFLVFHGRLGMKLDIRLLEIPENGQSTLILYIFQVISAAKGQDVEPGLSTGPPKNETPRSIRRPRP